MHGTRYEARRGRIVRIVDRTGACHAELRWDDTNTDRLVRLTVEGASVEGAVIQHPLLGDAHVVGDTAMTAVDWARPTEIPAIAEPARLAPGAGSAILNTLAVLAVHADPAGVASLRYAGPYPTAALWRTLIRSFRCDADEAAFTADALGRAVRVARDALPIEFRPAPHERIAITGGFVELRDGVERAVLAGISFEPDGSPARLVADGPDAGHRCEIWFGDAPYARIATLAADGALLDGPHPVPPCVSPVLGRAFPAALCEAIAEIIADTVAAPLATDARAVCAAGPLRWADLGARAAAELPGGGDGEGGFAVHAALWDRIAPLGMARLALALAEALAPVIAVAVVRRAAAASAPPR